MLNAQCQTVFVAVNVAIVIFFDISNLTNRKNLIMYISVPVSVGADLGAAQPQCVASFVEYI